MKLAITGSFGTGKTTQLFDLAREYKYKYPAKSIGIIQEIARFCPFPVNETPDIESQAWIFSTQLKEEIEYSKLYDIVLCDRTLFDSVAYAKVNGLEKEANLMYQLALDFVTTYDSIIFRNISKSDFLIADGFRSTNIKFRQDVENELLEIYDYIQKNYNYLKFEKDFGFELIHRGEYGHSN